MDREDESPKPCEAQTEFAEETPHQQGVDDVQKNAGEMIAERVLAPELPLQPENGLVDGVILDPTAGTEPELPEPAGIVQRGIHGDIPLVVPNQAAAKRRPINPQSHPGNEKELRKPRPP